MNGVLVLPNTYFLFCFLTIDKLFWHRCAQDLLLAIFSGLLLDCQSTSRIISLLDKALASLIYNIFSKTQFYGKITVSVQR